MTRTPDLSHCSETRQTESAWQAHIHQLDINPRKDNEIHTNNSTEWNWLLSSLQVRYVDDIQGYE